MSQKHIERSNDKRIDELEVTIMNELELVELPLVHRFTNGMYIREIFMPIGALVTSKVHMTEHPFTISKGRALVSIDGKDWQELEAPYTGITKPGTRRILYIIEDCVWTTYHPIPRIQSSDNELSEDEKLKIIEGIEEEILQPYINSITGTDVNKEYKRLLQDKKSIEL